MRRYVLALVCFILLLTGCAPQVAEVVQTSFEREAATPRPAEEWRAASGGEADAASPGAVSQAADVERMMIYTGRLAIVVDDTAVSMNRIKEIVSSFGGYVANSSSWYEGDPESEQLRAHMTIRVPAESLDEAITRVKDLATKVSQEELSGEDVTEEYTDLSAQVRNLEATETELRELLREVRESQGEADQILKVHQRLTEVRGQIERLKGRVQYLERSSALARVDIDIFPEELKKPVVESGWRPAGIVRNAARALVNTLQVLAGILIWLLIYSPVIAIPVVIVLLVRRRRRRRKAAKAEAEAEADSG